MLKIRVDRCKGCQLCFRACPKNLLELSQCKNDLGYYTVAIRSQEDCLSCALCACVCPDCAIEVYRPEREGKRRDG